MCLARGCVDRSNMTRDEFNAYLRAFNQADCERLADFFTPDALFLHLPPLPTLRGRDEILAFYRDFKSKVSETIAPLELFFDRHGIAAEVSGEFVALADWPEFPAVPLAAGDVFRLSGVVFYKTEGARFTQIRNVARLTVTLTGKDGRTRNLLSPSSDQPRVYHAN